MNAARRLLAGLARRVALRWTVVVRDGPGAGLRVDARRSSAGRRLGDNERPVQDAVARLLAPGGVFYDVGANIGYYALVAGRIVGERGVVVAIEPVAENVRAIERNAALNGLTNIRVVGAAAGAAPGRAMLALACHPGGSALVGHASPPDVAGHVEVEVVSVDALVEWGLPAPTLVKIDVEGAELAVIDGLARTLAGPRPVVLCEVDGETRAAVEARLAEVEGRLRGVHYDVSRLPDSYAGAGWVVVHVLATPRP